MAEHIEENTSSAVAFPMDGVLFHVFTEFILDCGGPVGWEKLTTTDINNLHQSRVTADLKISYCQWRIENGRDGVGTASVFISHAWRYNFLDIYETLKTRFENDATTYLWFDLFSNNQHIASSLPFEWWCDTFQNAIKQLGSTVLVLSPWEKPIPLTRSWCLWEIFCTVKMNCKFDVLLSSTDKDLFLKKLRDEPLAYFNMLSHVDVRTSEAWKEEDQQRILEAVESSHSCGYINSMVSRRLREWFLCMTKDNVGNGVFESEDDELRAKSDLAYLYQDQGNYLDALPLLQYTYTRRVAMNGEEHRESLTAIENLALINTHLGRHTEALQYSLRSRELKERVLGVNDTGTLVAVSNLALANKNLCRYEEALSLYKYLLEARRRIHGMNHARTLITLGSIAFVYNCIGKHELALATFKDCWEKRKANPSWGYKHPHTLSAMNSVAFTYHQMGQLHKAKSLYEECLYIRDTVLGTEHPSTLNSMFDLAMLLKSIGDTDTALSHLHIVCDKRTRVLGPTHPATVKSLAEQEVLLQFLRDKNIKLTNVQSDNPDNNSGEEDNLNERNIKS